MNSANLQKTFPKEYEEFFSSNNLVVSCPHVINRGNITHLNEIKVKVAQKMPTKMYIGVNIRKDSEVHVKTVTRYVTLEKRFETRSLEIALGKDAFQNIESIIKTKLIEYGYNQGVDFTVFSENQKDTGTATYSILILIITIAIEIIAGKLSPEVLNDYDTFTKSKEFKSLYTKAKEMLGDILPEYKKDINSTIFFTGCINKGNIGIGLEGDFLASNYPKEIQYDNNVCLDHTSLQARKILEYSIINFGGFFDEFYSTETYNHTQQEYEKIMKHYKLSYEKTNPFLNQTNFLYLKMFASAKEGMLNPNDEQTINLFFTDLSRLGSYQVFIEKHMDLYRDVVASFKKNITYEDEKIGLIPISSAKSGGTFLCITKPEKSQETLKKTTEELRNMGYKKAHFQYCSWIDGVSEEYPKIEQFLDKNIYSDYIQKDSVILRLCCSNEKRIGKHTAILNDLPDGLVFDTIHKKIYIDKQPVTHDDILSQSATVEMMDKICCENHFEHSTSNKSLPASSYSKNKNEMTGKIILPLQKLVEKKYKKKLPLTCSGSITDFMIRLGERVVPIYFICQMIETVAEII